MTKSWKSFSILIVAALVLSLGIMALPIAGTAEAYVPSEAWVDDDAPDDWYTTDPTHFNNIQDGIDNVTSNSTVHVLAGTYEGFEIDGRSGISIIGEEGAMVNHTIEPELGLFIMAGVVSSTKIDITGLDFDGSEITEKVIIGMFYVESTGSVTDVNVKNIVGTATDGPSSIGIMAIDTGMTTLNISNTVIEGCRNGVWVGNDHVNLANCTITGLADEDIPGAGVLAVMGATVNVDGCDISDFRVQNPELDFENGPEAGFGILVGMPGEPEDPVTVTVTGCSRIFDNNYGIYVDDDGDLVIHDSNIEGNTEYGIYKENAPSADATENWWGAADGPCHSPGSGDKVSDNVDYEPWLDAPSSESGNPTYSLHAAFTAMPTKGAAPLRVKFTDESEGTINAWLWDFGDGRTSTAENPTHTYMRAGRNTVTLTITGPGDAEDETTGYITVISAVPGGEAAKPANFAASYLDISPGQVLPNQQVEISINIANHGGERGSHSVVLYINGNAEQSQTVGVSPDSCQLVTFQVSKATPGTYQISVEGQTGQFTVLGLPTPTETSYFGGGLGTGGIVVVVVVAVALALAIVLAFAHVRRD